MGANDEGKETLIMKKDDNITLHQETKNIDKKRNLLKKQNNIPIFTEEDKVYRFLQNEF